MQQFTSPQRPGSLLIPATIGFALLLVAIVIFSFALVPKKAQAPNNTGTICTADARLCPDGSAVGRTGPNCEFTLCPGEEQIASFDDCVAAGYPVMESYPRQCAANHQTFTEVVANTNASTTNSSVDTTGWLVYTSTTDNYTLRYPTTYAQTVRGDNILFDKNGSLEQSALQSVSVTVFRSADPSLNALLDLYTWAKNGFSRTAPIVQYHANPTTFQLGENIFTRTDGDTGSSGIPEYFIFHNNVLYEFTDIHPSTSTSLNQDIISTLQFID